MAYPAYIPTRIVTLGGAASLESSMPLRVTVQIKASRSLVWGATGYRFEATGTTVTGESNGSEVSLPLPLTDLSGWRDAVTGAIIDTSSPDSFSHTYTATAQIGEKAYAYGPFVVPAGSEPIDIDLTVPAGTVAGGAVSISNSWSASILAAEEGAEAAGPAVLQTQAAAAEAAASAAQAQAIALSEVSEAQGAVFKVQSTPPENATEGGLPVVWIDTTEQFVPTPVNPPTLAWDDALSRFTVPTGVIGVEYVWTSGGGGVGATLMPGATLSTSGAYPRTVTVTPVAKLGYVLASGVVSFVHDFPDPSAVTVMTSDGFGGSARVLNGRTPDLAVGGTLLNAWADVAGVWAVDGPGCWPTWTQVGRGCLCLPAGATSASTSTWSRSQLPASSRSMCVTRWVSSASWPQWASAPVSSRC